MRFDEQLDQYMKAISCTNRDLAEASGLGTGTISRYHNGQRTPSPDSLQLTKLAHGLACLMAQKDEEKDLAENCSEAEILNQFHAILDKDKPKNYDHYLTNLNTLLNALDIKNVNLARYLHMDPSHVSRILAGKRHPVDASQLLGDITAYIAKHCATETNLATMASLYGCSPEELADTCKLQERTSKWLGSDATSSMDDSVCSFLEKLNDFDLNDFMHSMHFANVKNLDESTQFPDIKLYSGISEMMCSELDFLKAVCLSSSMQDLIFYCDMPMMEMSGDHEYTKQFMFALASLMRKGLRLHNIHDVHRPLPEMLLGLEGWLPMYMTGQITPYYLKEQTNHTFMHLIRSAGTVAEAGEAIAGKHAHGRYIVTTKQEDVLYYRRRAEDLLKKSQPLMHIFRKEQEADFLAQMKTLQKEGNAYRIICSAPPLFTMSPSLLNSILKRNNISRDNAEKIVRFSRDMKEYVESDLQSTWMLELPKRRSACEDESTRLALSWLFPTVDVCYTEEEYQAHLRETEAYSATHPSVSFSINPYAAFRNIDVIVVMGKYVLISKCNTPAIHFIIYHPKIVNAFEQFTPTLALHYNRNDTRMNG